MKVIIIGGGQVGSYIANILIEHKCDIMIIENREQILKKLKKEFDHSYILEGDGTDPANLEKAGIGDADVVAAVTGADEANLVVSTIAKYEFGVDRVIARVNHPKNEWLFDLEMGVDVKVNQAELLARLVVNEIDLRNILTLMKINHGDYSIVQTIVCEGSKANGKKIKDLEVPETVVFIAITRGDQVILPKGDVVLQGEDHVIALADEQAQTIINALLG